jgi:hypothetical protein
MLDGAEGFERVGERQSAEQAFPEAGKAAEVARHRVGLAEAGGQFAPGAPSGGHPEHRVHAPAGALEQAAGAVLHQHEGEECVPLGVGQRLPAAGFGIVAAAHGEGSPAV